MTKNGFSLVEIIVVIGIVSTVIAFTIPTVSNIKESLDINLSAKTISSLLRKCQQEAISKCENISIVLELSQVSYDNKIIKIPGNVKIKTPQKVIFSSSGNPVPGFFGTIAIASKNYEKKIVISPYGRIRVG